MAGTSPGAPPPGRTLSATNVRYCRPQLPTMLTCQEAAFRGDDHGSDGAPPRVITQHHLQNIAKQADRQGMGGGVACQHRLRGGLQSQLAAQLLALATACTGGHPPPTCRECSLRSVTRPLVPAASSRRPSGEGHKEASRSCVSAATMGHEALMACWAGSIDFMHFLAVAEPLQCKQAAAAAPTCRHQVAAVDRVEVQLQVGVGVHQQGTCGRRGAKQAVHA
jgi:hypothetical protein